MVQQRFSHGKPTESFHIIPIMDKHGRYVTVSVRVYSSRVALRGVTRRGREERICELRASTESRLAGCEQPLEGSHQCIHGADGGISVLGNCISTFLMEHWMRYLPSRLAFNSNL
jgi:hypothetical protein